MSTVTDAEREWMCSTSKHALIQSAWHRIQEVAARTTEAHARLDAVVQRVASLEAITEGHYNVLIDRRSWMNDIEDRLTALKSTVEAMKNVRTTDIARVTALYNRVTDFESAFNRLTALELSDLESRDVGIGLHQRLTVLESAPRSEPVRDDPMCDECGHRKSCHNDEHGCGFGQCYCREFVAPTPASAPAQPVDPVLMAISGAWKQWYGQSARSVVVGLCLEDAFRLQSGIHESRDITRDLLFYGAPT